MKKLLFLTLLFIPTLASAAEDSSKWMYMGLDLQRTRYSYNDNYSLGAGAFLDGDTILEENLNGANIYIGGRFSEYFGLELGYFRNKEETKGVSAGTVVGTGTVAATSFTTDVKSHGFALDALGYVPVAPGLEIVGTAGVTWTDAEIGLSGAGIGKASADEDEFGYRLGAGLQYTLENGLGFRGLVRYQYADFDNIADDAWIYTLGVNYRFNTPKL